MPRAPRAPRTRWSAKHPGLTLAGFTLAGGPHTWDVNGVAYRFPTPDDAGYATLASPDTALWWCIRGVQGIRGARAPEPDSSVSMLGRKDVLGDVRLGGVYARPSGTSGMAYVDVSTPRLDVARTRVLARAGNR
jgi:hypothetical protein